MNAFQIEAWALRVIDAVNAGQPNEDFRVELKREWIEAKKAARILAGHANSAQGENILWLIGVDEKQQKVIGVNANDFASWSAQLESCFSELSPRLTSINIPIEGKTVVAILFETDRAPFVVKAPDGGAIQFEVPWREGTRTRSARRADLIRLLTPLEQLPDIEILRAFPRARIAKKDKATGNDYSDEFSVILELYIVPKINAQVVIPLHRCQGWFEIPGILPQAEFVVGLYHKATAIGVSRSSTVELTATEAIVTGPGALNLQAITYKRPVLPNEFKNIDVQVVIHLGVVHSDRPIVLTTTFPYPPEQ